jgi:rhodanese-related sulfurtransferase
MSISTFIQANIWLVMIAVVSVGVLVWPFIGKRMSSHKQVEPLQLVQLINRNQAVVVDVREEAEFAAGHVVGSRHVPQSKLSERLSELHKLKNKSLVIVCQTGMRSGSASSVLVKSGFTDVAILAGGLAAWQQANLPLEK